MNSHSTGKRRRLRRAFGRTESMAHNMFITRLDSRRQAFGAAEIVTIDIYRMKDGQAVEHWDAIPSVVKTTASGQTPALPVPPMTPPAKSKFLPDAISLDKSEVS